jgi:hypothetical protein
LRERFRPYEITGAVRRINQYVVQGQAPHEEEKPCYQKKSPIFEQKEEGSVLNCGVIGKSQLMVRSLMGK